MLVGAALLFLRCGRNPEPVVEQKPAAATKPVVSEGRAFNARFPKGADGMDVTFTQEKDGYAQADLTRGGKKIAQLSISDTNANPSARDKFASATRKIAGLPAAAVGNMGTAVLAAGRYQVQVRSLDKGFAEADRVAWIQKFDLEGWTR